MNSKQRYLLMKHLVRLERAWESIEDDRKKEFILRWTNGVFGRVNGLLIPKGSLVITIDNLEVLKTVVETIQNLLIEQIRTEMVGACIPDNMAYKKGGRFYINGKYLRRAFDDLYDIAKQSTLSPWLEQKPCGDRLEARWVYKKWALRLPNTLTELFATPEELIKGYY
mgnify:CR=1 FL=1